MHKLSRQKLSVPPEEAVLPFTYHLFLSLCYPSLCLWLGNWSELQPTIIWAGLLLAYISSWSVSLQGCTEIFCANSREGTMWRQGWSRCLEKRELRRHQLKESMKLQPFSWLCFAGVQLMCSVGFLLFCHVAIVPHPFQHNRWSTLLLIPPGFSHHSCFPRWDTGSTEFSWRRGCHSCPHPRQDSGVWWSKRKLQPTRSHLPPLRSSASSFGLTASAPSAQQPRTGFLLAEPQLDKLLHAACS